MRHLIWSLAAFVGVVQMAFSGELLTTSDTASFDCDTVVPHAVTSSSAVTLPKYAANATITVVTPSGKSSTLVSGASAYSWTPDEGGMWTVKNSVEGTAEFTVRYTLFPGTEGAGTAESPLKIVDGDELVDLVNESRIDSGTVFSLNGGEGLYSRLECPDGYGVLLLGDGLYRLDESADGLVVASEVADFVADTVGEGPDRRGKKRDPWPGIAFTGDGWAGSADAASTLTVTSPKGVASSNAHVGSGAVEFAPDATGVWTVELSYGSTTLTSAVTVTDFGTVLFVR